MGILFFEFFDWDLLKVLVFGCCVIVLVSVGYNEFDVEWMVSEGIYFCNIVNVVVEVMVDMVIFFIFVVLRNIINVEKSVWSGIWCKGVNFVFMCDFLGFMLGIVGMGVIGKVNCYEFRDK